MILDGLRNAERYSALITGLAEAFDFLRRPDLDDLADGRHAIDGERLYAMIVRGNGRPRTDARLEYHRRYLDVQFSVSGTDVIGWRELSTCAEPSGDYDGKTDCGLYADAPDAWIPLPPGMFIILLPSDAHAPMTGDGTLHKAVVKLRVG